MFINTKQSHQALKACCHRLHSCADRTDAVCAVRIKQTFRNANTGVTRTDAPVILIYILLCLWKGHQPAFSHSQLLLKHALTDLYMRWQDACGVGVLCRHSNL
jgi:hypothetical protein